MEQNVDEHPETCEPGCTAIHDFDDVDIEPMIVTEPMTYAVAYVGASSGKNKTGEILSRHKSLEDAQAEQKELQMQHRYSRQSTEIRVSEDGGVSWRRAGHAES